jgi:hypothetical protein
MTATAAALAIAVWLVLQIPIGMAIGCYIRRAQTLAAAYPCFEKRETRRSKRRPFAQSRPPAALLGN